MLKANPEPLKAINVGTTNNEGSVDRLMSLDELARVGCVGLYPRTITPIFGGGMYELTIARPPTSQQNSTFEGARTKQQGGNIIDG